MGASMANVTRIKAKDSSDKSEKSENAEISRKVSIKAKNSENTKAKAAAKKATKAKAKELRKEGKEVSVILGFNTKDEIFYEDVEIECTVNNDITPTTKLRNIAEIGDDDNDDDNKTEI